VVVAAPMLLVVLAVPGTVNGQQGASPATSAPQVQQPPATGAADAPALPGASWWQRLIPGQPSARTPGDGALAGRERGGGDAGVCRCG
jgi:hypothetical protein